MNKNLYVVVCVSNPRRFKSRYELYRKFEKYIKDSGAILYTVEQAFGDRDFEITEEGNPNHIRIRSNHEIWHKENMLNIGISRLPADWKYMAWLDADISFARTDWVEETIQMLQHHKIVQMFSSATDLGPNFEPLHTHTGFAYNYVNGVPLKKEIFKNGYYTAGKHGCHDWHPGFAWAIRRETFEDLGGFIDYAILGSADRHMACAFIEEIEISFYPGMRESNPVFTAWLLEWQDRCKKYVCRDIGYVDGLVLHNWHGAKKNRGYNTRWKVLIETKFDPFLDLKRDYQGLYQLTDRNLSLRDQLRKYFRSRNEDSIEV